MKKIGFIGTGIMGKSMVRNLMKAGFELSVYNRSRGKAEELLAEGARWCATPADCARGQDAVITIVGYPADVEAVYFGENGIFEGAGEGCYLIDMTTTSPRLAQRLYAEGRQRGLHVLDAPVSGGDTGAKNGMLAIMVGGDEDDFETCHTLFSVMGKTIQYEGTAGSGQHVKMANQIAIAGAIAGVSEALAYTRAVGVDAQRMLQTISGGAAGSWQLSNNGPKMAEGDFAPGFMIQHFIKDMGLADSEAMARELKLPVLEGVLAMYKALAEAGLENEGTQALIEYYKAR